VNQGRVLYADINILRKVVVRHLGFVGGSRWTTHKGPWPGLARKYQWYIGYQRYIYQYHDSIMIFSSKNIVIFLIFSKYQPLLFYYYYLLTFLIHAYLIQTAQVPKLLNGAKILPKISSLWVWAGRKKTGQQRHRRQTQTDGSCHDWGERNVV